MNNNNAANNYKYVLYNRGHCLASSNVKMRPFKNPVDKEFLNLVAIKTKIIRYRNSINTVPRVTIFSPLPNSLKFHISLKLVNRK